MAVLGAQLQGPPAAALTKPAKKAPAAKKAAGPAQKPAAAPDGMLLASSRDVTVRPDGAADWKEAEVGQPLARRDRVRTGKAATATLDAAGARLWLDPSSQILLLGEKVKRGKAGVELVEGAVRVSVDPAGAEGKQRLGRVQVGDSEVRVRGTARVQAGATGELQVAVYAGAAEVTGKRGAVKLQAGTGALLRRGARPKVGGLIAAPAWAEGGGLFFALPQPGQSVAAAELQLPFKPVTGAARYRVEVGRDEALTDRVYVGTVAAEARQATARVNGKGRFFARIEAIDSDQVPGPGPVQALQVVEVRGERLSASVGLPAPGAALRPVLLTGAGEVAFELVPPGGRLQVQLDGKPVSSDGGVVPLRLGRGLHQVTVQADGARGELRVEVSRPSYAVEISQERQASSGRGYRVEIRALDAVGRAAAGGDAVQARTVALVQGDRETGPGEALGLTAKGAGVLAGELEVPAGKVVRLRIQDADGVVAVADLAGPGAVR